MLWILLVPTLSGVAFSSLRVDLKAARRCPTPRLQMGDAEEVPTDLETICNEASGTVRNGILRGVRGMRVDIGVPAVNTASPMFEADVLGRICLELAKPFLLLEGSILMLLPGVSTSSATMQLLQDSMFDWPDGFQERVQVSTLSLHGPPNASFSRNAVESPLAAVLVVGLQNSKDSDDPSFLNGRKWLALAGPSCPVVRLLPSHPEHTLQAVQHRGRSPFYSSLSPRPPPHRYDCSASE